ncbi:MULTISPECIES: thioredoxin family protein [Paenibacillus]|uniref:thioredoxin family protein n=1 Tax=Paenibacillus TaxID=44249 RepID=UPI00203E41FE|nr:thioredoxin family protein [Paenibacillus camelliae]MCM3634393.1 thioredoxin family protein [Paenibacillus camelliae]
MIRITNDAQFHDLVGRDKLTIVVFKTTWCGDCHYINPFMPDVVQQYEGKATFYEVDRDELPDLCIELNILGIPSFIAYKDGKEIARFVSKLRKTREEIEQFVNRTIEMAELL